MKVKLVHGGGGGGDEKVGMALLGWDSHAFSCPLTLQGRVLHVVSPASLQEPLAA